MLDSPKAQRHFTELPPLSLYVHIPWCIKKCPYCDFNSHEQQDVIPENAYINALLDDLADEMPQVWGRSFSTVFIGGGTPSLFSASGIDKLLSGIRSLTALSPNAEVTLEANPGTFEQEKFSDYRAAGVNRLSIGIQSFNHRHLKSLGRVHSDREALDAVQIAHTAGFEQINLDMMFALPEQTIDELVTDIDTAINLGTTHLSFYELTLEPNTYFARFPPKIPDNDARAHMQDLVADTLAAHHFDRYEISAYAKGSATKESFRKEAIGNRSQHNMNYWQFGDYVGIGAGAHGKISSASNGHVVRRWKHKHPQRYLNARSASERLGAETPIAIADSALEFMMNALRLREGFAVPLFRQHTGVELDYWQPNIERSIERGLLAQTGLNLHTTPTGFNWLNELLQEFMPAAETNNTKVLRYPIISLKPVKSES